MGNVEWEGKRQQQSFETQMHAVNPLSTLINPYVATYFTYYNFLQDTLYLTALLDLIGQRLPTYV